MYAISGSLSSQTIRVKEMIKRQPITILIDSNSSHNFIDQTLFKKIQYCINKEKLKVMEANKEKLATSGNCTDISISIQEFQFHSDFYMLSLRGCDVVLGTHWLHTLGPIL